MVVEGKVEKEDGVINVLARRIVPLRQRKERKTTVQVTSFDQAQRHGRGYH